MGTNGRLGKYPDPALKVLFWPTDSAHKDDPTVGKRKESFEMEDLLIQGGFGQRAPTPTVEWVKTFCEKIYPKRTYCWKAFDSGGFQA